MTDLAISFFTSLIGGGAGIGVVVFALSKWLGSVWKERIGRLEDARITIETLQEQATIDTIAREHTADLEERLKFIEQSHEKSSAKEEHFHQISQETYQKLFDKKVEIYSEIFTLVSKIEASYPYFPLDIAEKVLSGQVIELQDIVKSAHSEFIYRHYNELISIFDKNLSILSSSLIDSYFSWRDEIKPELDNLNNHTMEIISSMIDVRNNPNNYSDVINSVENTGSYVEYSSKLKKLIIYQNNLDRFEVIVNQVRCDIKDLNSRIDSIFISYKNESFA